MAITAALVKELREKSGAGMMDAKKALTETDGDMEAAQDWLRTKGLAKAEKKSGRTAAEGLIGVKTDGGMGVAVEINSETDFVAKNSEFQAMVASIADAAATVDDVEALKAAHINGKPVADVVTDAIAKIGENMGVRRMAKISGDNVASYVHNAAADGMGTIGVLVAYTGDDADFARGVGMHIAAINPASQSEDDLDASVVEKEKSIQMDIARESGKPEPVIEKMIGGRMQNWLSEVTLLNQAYVKSEDGKTTVAAAAEAAGVTITGFVRLEVGEGIEVEKEDFAAEVAKAARG